MIIIICQRSAARAKQMKPFLSSSLHHYHSHGNDDDDDDHHFHNHQPRRSPPLLAAHCNECRAFCRQRLGKFLLITLSLDLRRSYPQYAATHHIYYIIHSTNKDGKDQKQGSKINLWTHGPTNCSIYKNSPAREGGVKLKHNLNQSFKQFPQNCLFGTVLAPYSIH